MGNFQPTIDYVSVKTNGVNFFEQILKFLSAPMELPTLYGWYHILCFVVTIGLCVLVCFKARKLTDKQFNMILGLSGVLLLLLELYKQLQYSYDYVSDTWSYQWYAFPFQFCATPMYLLVLASLLKNGKVKESLCSYLATYALFAGTAVMFYPGDVFIRVIGINIQTMVHHGGMVVIGVFMYVSGRVKLSHKTVLKALPTFCACLGLAMVMNILYAQFGDPNQAFNMFFVSPYYPCTLPVLSSIYGKVPYPIFLAIYIFGFTVCAYVMCLLAMGVKHLSAFLAERKIFALAVTSENGNLLKKIAPNTKPIKSVNSAVKNDTSTPSDKEEK